MLSGCRQGETLGFDVSLPSVGSVAPAVTSAKWVLMRGDYADAVRIFSKPATVVLQNGIRLLQFDIAMNETALWPVGEFFQFARVRFADGRVKDVESGPFVVTYAPPGVS